MNTQPHIIHKQVLNIALPGSPQMLQVQADLARWCRLELPLLLGELCDQLSTGSETIRIEKLCIDLGNTRSEKEMTEQLRVKFREALLPLMQQEKNTMAEQITAMEILRRFLLEGTLPAGDETKARAAIHEITRSQGVAVSSEYYKLFREAAQHSHALQRLVCFYSRDELAAIAASLSGQDAKTISAQLDEIFRLLKQAVATGGEQLRTNTWKNLFSFFRTGSPVASAENMLLLLFQAVAPAANRSLPELVQLLHTEIRNEQQQGKSSDSGILPFVEKMLYGKNKLQDVVKEQTTPEKETMAKEKTIFPDVVWPDDSRISHAGSILLWPFLPEFFRKQHLVEKEIFVNEAAQHHALLLLQYIITGTENTGDLILPVVKLLCGVSLSETIETKPLTAEERNACDEMLRSVIAAWPALKSAAPPYLRIMFLEREGQLKKQNRSWTLRVRPETQDILLGKLSWSVSAVRMPWSKTLIYTEWS